MDCPECCGEMEQEEILTESETNLTILFECSDCGYSKTYSRKYKRSKESAIILIREEIPTHGDRVDSFLKQTKYLAETLSRDVISFNELEDEFRVMLFSDDEYIRDARRDFIAGLDI